jgi:drug/metabolite transporter (DMT)-like permease
MNVETQALVPSRTGKMAAFATIYIVWGSTYLAMRVAIETLPPFLMAGVRFLIAGGALFLWLCFRGEPLPAKKHWLFAAIAGLLMLGGGNGLVVWSEQFVSSGLAALVVGLTPVWFAALEWLRPGGRRPEWRTIFGILVGFSGVVLLVTARESSSHQSAVHGFWSVGALMLASISWAGGSLFAKYNPSHRSPWMNAAMQMICGGAALLVLGLGTGESGRWHWDRVSAQSKMALSYLIIFGSWIGFGVYVWLLKHSKPSHVATYAYVNPVIALFLGRLLLGELINAQILWATGFILAGVVITTLPKMRWEH